MPSSTPTAPCDPRPIPAGRATESSILHARRGYGTTITNWAPLASVGCQIAFGGQNPQCRPITFLGLNSRHPDMPCDFSVFEGVSRATEAFAIVKVDDDSLEKDELRTTALSLGFLTNSALFATDEASKLTPQMSGCLELGGFSSFLRLASD